MDPTDASLLQQALVEIDRYRSMDRLIPSVHNVVSIATIEVRLTHIRPYMQLSISQFSLLLGVANLIPNDLRMFIPLTRSVYSAVDEFPSLSF